MSFFQQLFTSPLTALVFILSVIVAISVHEFAHAWTADRFGDPTPGLQGRLSLSPLAHLDPLGALAFVLFGFGWGKPVVYNPMHLRSRIQELWIALAGPFSNLLLAMLVNAALFVLLRAGAPGNAVTILGVLSEVNVTLAAFNLLPFPPLDGSSIVAYFWPEYRSPRLSQISSLVLIAILLLLPGVLSEVLTPVINGATELTRLFGLLP